MMLAHKFEALGTYWSIETPQPLGELNEKVETRLAEFDRSYSRFRDDSFVSQLRLPGTYVLPADALPLLTFYRKLYEATHGVVTPLVGEALEQAGYDAQYSLQPKTGLATVPVWDDVMRTENGNITIYQPIVLDVGAAGKGYAVDSIAKMLEEAGVQDYVIDASGDIRSHGNLQRIGLEHPTDSSSILGVAEIKNQSLCASSSNRRQWGRWHHIINGHTSQPASEVVATWVVADSTMVADGLATALFFVPFKNLAQWQFQAVRLLANGQIESTNNFNGELFV